MIDFWEGLWKIVLLVGLAVFGVMVVWVTIFGARDIAKLLRTLREQHERDGDDLS